MKPLSMFGLDFERVTLTQATTQVLALVGSGRGELIVTPNVDHVVQMDSDPEMLRIFRQARYRYADGMPVVWLSRLCDTPGLPERVTGADLLVSVAQEAAHKGASVFLLGGLPGIADKAAKALQARFPELVVSGTYCPPFGFEKDEALCQQIIDRVNRAGTNILFVGVGAPKQEKWAHRWRSELTCDAILGVGAAFDFAAGTTRRAPRLLQSTGLEWLWRLAGDPRRLGPRYLKDSRFIFLAAREIGKACLKSRAGADI